MPKIEMRDGGPCLGAAVPPGETIADLLEEHEMTQADLADRLGVSTKHLNQVIKGTASISPELALGLEKVFSVDADFWLTRESIYRGRLARHAERASLKSSIEWAKRFPVKELKARGFIPQEARNEDLVVALLQFLGIASVEQWAQPMVSYRKSQKFESDDYALTAWLRIGELKARAIDCKPFDADRFKDALQEIRHLTPLEPNEWVDRLTFLGAESGVAIVILHHFKQSRVNGATRWLTPHKAIIQLSLRQNWEDIFWFTFFHEAAHVLMHRKKLVMVEPVGADQTKMDPDIRELEEEADKFAAHTLIPPPFDRRLREAGLAGVPGLAKQAGIAPAILVGRLHHEGLLPYSRGNDMRRRYEF